MGIHLFEKRSQESGESGLVEIEQGIFPLKADAFKRIELMRKARHGGIVQELNRLCQDESTRESDHFCGVVFAFAQLFF
jgi:hypothetical protein